MKFIYTCKVKIQVFILGCELLIAKLKPIATTDEEKAVIKSLEAGKMSPKAAARIFEVSFSRLRKVIASKSRMIAKDMEKEKTENSIEHEIDPQVCPEQVENIPGPANKNGFPAVRNSDQEAHPNEAVSSVNEADISTSQSNASEHLEKTECKVKRERMKWNFENLDLALGAVKDGKLSLRGAARFYGIPKSTLGDFIKGKRSSGLYLVLHVQNSIFGHQKCSTSKTTNELEKYIHC